VLRTVRPIVPAPQVLETIGWGRWRLVAGLQVADEGVVRLAGDVALEAADDLGLGLAFGGAALGVGAGALAVAQPADGDHVQRAVGVAVAAVVRRWRSVRPVDTGIGLAPQRAGERCLVPESFDVLAGGHQQRAGVAGGDRDPGGGDWRGLGDELLELAIE